MTFLRRRAILSLGTADYSNPFAIVLSIPLLNKLVYPFLEARKIPHGPVRRVVAGFILAAAGMLWCGILQYAVSVLTALLLS